MVKHTELARKIHHALKAESARLYVARDPANARSYGCSISGCPNKAYAKRLCNAHYIRLRAGKDMEAPLRNRFSDAKCHECGKSIKGRGAWSLCHSHYRMRRREIIRTIAIAELGGCCARCKGIFPNFAYDFHHLNGDEKLLALGNAMDSFSIEELSLEISKCALLCAICHRIEHYEQRQLSSRLSDPP